MKKPLLIFLFVLIGLAIILELNRIADSLTLLNSKLVGQASQGNVPHIMDVPKIGYVTANDNR